MPQSLARIHIHLVFSTKNRCPCLLESIRPTLHAYMASVLMNRGCSPLSLGSVEDHIHILFSLPRTLTLSKAVETFKTSSSRWLKTQDADLSRFAWQSGYGAFSVSASHVKAVQAYIARQRERHRKVSFQDEFRSMLRAYDVAYDERYVWD